MQIEIAAHRVVSGERKPAEVLVEGIRIAHDKEITFGKSFQ